MLYVFYHNCKNANQNKTKINLTINQLKECGREVDVVIKVLELFTILTGGGYGHLHR
jgi:hypothetical protein